MGGHLVEVRPTKSGLGGLVGLVALFITDSGKRAFVGLSQRDCEAIAFYGLGMCDWFPLKSRAEGRWTLWRINWKEIT